MKPEQRAALYFLPYEEIADIRPFGNGNVNDTFLVTLVDGEERILQRVNPSVFPDPELVMRNLQLVTVHLQQPDVRQMSSDTAYQHLHLFRGGAGYSYRADDGASWRLMNRIPGGRTLQAIATPRQSGELGRALGHFHQLLNSMDPSCLEDPLPGFHITPGYLAYYDRIRSRAGTTTRPTDPFCCRFIEDRRVSAHLLEEARNHLRAGVIHGDPKVANFLFDDAEDRVISLIDLDTVKPGLLLHDLADCLRSCCNLAGETPVDPAQVSFDPLLFSAWLRGYLEEGGTLLGNEDLRLLPDAVALIAFELGLRFYTDHLEGDRYFKVADPGQNLQRAATQFQLARSIEDQLAQLKATVVKLIGAENNPNNESP